MPTALETLFTAELVRRPAYITATVAAYDGDPNDVAAPALLDDAPAGTEYQEETPDRLWKKDAGGTWVLVGATIDLSAVAEDVLPAANNTYDLGSASYQWADVRATAATITTVAATTVGATTGNITTVNATTVATTNVDCADIDCTGEIEFVIAARTVNPEVRHEVVTDANISRTLTNADWGRTIEMSHATPTVICPVSLTVGFWCKVRGSTAALTIDDDATATIVAAATVASPYTTTGQWADAVIECRATNAFLISGLLTQA